jgi:uncharacterized membrane protein
MLGKYLVVMVMLAFSAAYSAAQQPATKTDAATVDRLAHGRTMVQRTLNLWDFETWDQLLAPDVTVTFDLGAIGVDTAGEPAAIGAQVQVHGREDAKKALRQVYGDLKKNVNITGQIAVGNEVVLLGGLSVTAQNGKAESLPIACYLVFNSDGKIETLTVSSVDTRPLFEAAGAAAGQTPKPETARVERLAKGRATVQGVLNRWGSLLGALIAAPFTAGASAAVGAAALASGALLGGAIGGTGGALDAAWWKDDFGLSDTFVKDVSRMIGPGDSAIFAWIQSVDPELVARKFQGFGGRVLRTTLTPEQSAKLEQVLHSQV